MDKTKFSGGFTVRDDEEAMFGVEWLYDEREKDPEKLQFMAYDLNMYPMPDFDKWKDEEFKQKNIDIALRVTRDFKGSVWLDDTKIK